MPTDDEHPEHESAVSIERRFLDWSAPCLPQAASWLLNGAGSGRVLNLERTLCVVPGRRAGRSLLALLLNAAAQDEAALLPPRIVTPSVMVELLTIHAQPSADLEPVIVASSVESRFAWIETLRDASADERAALIPHPPPADDLPAWLALAEMIEHARAELAGERRTFADAASATERMGRDREHDRWRSLNALEHHYRVRLRTIGLTDVHDAREQSLTDGVTSVEFDRIVLIGAADLNRLQRDVLVDAGVPITSLIHAPEDRADQFDPFGCPLTEPWREARIDVEDSRHVLAVADRPADQAQAAMRAIASQEDQREAAELTIGLPDESLAAPLTTAATWAGLHLHHAGGTPLKRTPAARLLEAIADWLDEPRFTHFVALLRVPEIERAIERIDPDSWRGGRQHWLTLLDDYFTDHLQQRLTGEWLGKPERAAALKHIYNGVLELLEPLTGPPRPFHDWCAPVLTVLENVHRDEDLSHSERERLETLAGAINSASRQPPRRNEGCRSLSEAKATRRIRTSDQRNQPQRDPSWPSPGSDHGTPNNLSPTLDAARAIRLLLRLIGDQPVAPPRRRDEIDVLGWLELHLDPAPALVLTGVNDGALPASKRGDALLPDSLRTALGLMDNEQRYARDCYLLTAILHAREFVTLIAGKRGSEGDPLTPSRLLFACDDETLVERVKLMCDDAHHTRPTHPIGLALPAAETKFVVPELPRDLVIPDSLPVTAFRRFLECPYRFALEYLCGVEQRGVAEAELDPLQFGSLAHDVLERFGNDEAMRDAADADAIRNFLFGALHDLAKQRYGESPPAAVRIQIARLEARLRDFAPVQANLRREGWRIEHIEHRFEDGVPLDIDGQDPMLLRAMIDRIDRHESTGAFRIIDYKTSESGRSPMKAHHHTEKYTGEWADLQLPLYDYLARRGPIPADAADIELAYIILPKQTNGVRYTPARWTADEIDAGVAKAREIVQLIRAGRFERSTEYASPFDPFARITQSTTFNALMRGDLVEPDE